MDYCLACRSTNVENKEVQLVRVNIRTRQRTEVRKMNEITCRACGYQFSDEIIQTPLMLSEAI